MVTSVHPRKLARHMATKQLEKSKITGFNKERVDMTGRKMPSLFARNWRDLAAKAAAKVYTKKKRAKA